MYVKVRVTTGARKEKITKTDTCTFEMILKEPAERNLANKRIRTILATHYAVTESAIQLITGHHSPRKVFDVHTED